MEPILVLKEIIALLVGRITMIMVAVRITTDRKDGVEEARAPVTARNSVVRADIVATKAANTTKTLSTTKALMETVRGAMGMKTLTNGAARVMAMPVLRAATEARTAIPRAAESVPVQVTGRNKKIHQQALRLLMFSISS